MTRPSIAAVVLVLLVLAPGLQAADEPIIPLGTLTLRTEPEVEVLWDGTLLGQTDSEGSLEISDIPPGGYTLNLRKTGHEDLTQRLEITPSHQTLALTLTPVVVSERPAELEETSPAPPVPVAAGERQPRSSVLSEFEESKPAASVPVETRQEPPSVSAPADAGATLPSTTLSTPLPAGDAADPSSAVLWAAIAASLILLAFTAAGLMSRRSRRRQSAARAASPRVVASERTPSRSKSPAFFDDLRQREDTLDTFVEGGRNRPRRQVKIIDAEIVDPRSGEEEDAE